MPEPTALTVKQQVRSMLDRLPEGSTFEDVQYHLYVMQRVLEGLAQVDGGQGIAHEEAKRRLKTWLKE